MLERVLSPLTGVGQRIKAPKISLNSSDKLNATI